MADIFTKMDENSQATNKMSEDFKRVVAKVHRDNTNKIEKLEESVSASVKNAMASILKKTSGISATHQPALRQQHHHHPLQTTSSALNNETIDGTREWTLPERGTLFLPAIDAVDVRYMSSTQTQASLNKLSPEFIVGKADMVFREFNRKQEMKEGKFPENDEANKSQMQIAVDMGFISDTRYINNVE